MYTVVYNTCTSMLYTQYSIYTIQYTGIYTLVAWQGRVVYIMTWTRDTVILIPPPSPHHSSGLWNERRQSLGHTFRPIQYIYIIYIERGNGTELQEGRQEKLYNNNRAGLTRQLNTLSRCCFDARQKTVASPALNKYILCSKRCSSYWIWLGFEPLTQRRERNKMSCLL